MKEERVIFFDLDGTILDLSERNYKVYKNILKKYNRKFLSKKIYLELKRNKTPIQEILKKTNGEDIVKQFKKKWYDLIEREGYLKLDKISQNRKLFLLRLKKKYSLILVTLRHNQDALYHQLREKKLINIFHKILVSSGKKAKNKWKIKLKLIKSFEKHDKNSIMVGDTESDILAGKNWVLKQLLFGAE
jgi:phosphoglycolate phosphatase-like HAD superfamily hydrolase